VAPQIGSPICSGILTTARFLVATDSRKICETNFSNNTAHSSLALHKRPVGDEADTVSRSTQSSLLLLQLPLKMLLAIVGDGADIR